MDSPTVITAPGSDRERAGLDEAGVSALAEIDAAIALVTFGAARRVRLTALPFVETVAAIGLAHATTAGMAFAYERPERAGVATVTVGPMLPSSARDDG